jgi:putative ABC transport system permease protein
VLRSGLTPALAGLAAGILGAAALTRLMGGLLFGVTPLDGLTYGAVTAILITAASIACYIPARRALRVDPTTALRAD